VANSIDAIQFRTPPVPPRRPRAGGGGGRGREGDHEAEQGHPDQPCPRRHRVRGQQRRQRGDEVDTAPGILVEDFHGRKPRGRRRPDREADDAARHGAADQCPIRGHCPPGGFTRWCDACALALDKADGQSRDTRS
jgi:hypothetical protein